MELISEYFNWCEGGRKSGIDPRDRVSSSASEEKEEEAAIRIRSNGKNERQCIKGRRRRRNDR
ncbi:hypothetical protein VitviT2T_013133 [Vitis vinifera]|uniref:Uncharacterized protein n=1 Tax=Vitis vinifera TaxID=29760 RepID=A0ABY9CFT5_VITVI|nr:hypothetical protein VitviT2T_013133 [Vitis vinifera]